jgi:hypothetical protein
MLYAFLLTLLRQELTYSVFFDKGNLHRACPMRSNASLPARSDQAGIAVESVRCRYLTRSSWVGDDDDVIKLPCHPNAGDRRERLKVLSAAGEISVVFERLAQRIALSPSIHLWFRSYEPAEVSNLDTNCSG